jgi:ADP-ribose pyrophosphatase
MQNISHTNDKPIVLAEGKYIRVLSENGWEYVERIKCTGIAVIVALTENDELLFVEQFRRPVHKNVIEFPAGLVGDIDGKEHESIEHAAKRELFEETGYEAGDLVFLTEGPPSAGQSTEIVTFFGALGVRKTGEGGGDETESIVLHTIQFNAVEDWLLKKQKEGILIDPKVYGGIYLIKKLAGIK